MLRFFCVVLLATLAAAGSIDFEPCSGNDLPVGTKISLDVDGVDDGATEVTLVKGKTYSLTIRFTAGSASATLQNTLFGEISGIPIAWGGVEKDACAYHLPVGSCPLVSGTAYTHSADLEVLASYPSTSLVIIWKLVDASGKNQVCFRLPATITN